MLERISRTRPALATVLAIAFGTLMLFAVGSVFIVGISGAGRNTTELLADKADLILASLDQRIRQQFEPVMMQAEYLRLLIERGQIDLGKPNELVVALRSALGATPQVNDFIFLRPDFTITRVERIDGIASLEDWSQRPEIVEGFRKAQRGLDLGYGQPLWSDQLRQTIIPFVLPVRRDGKIVGILLAAITVAELSQTVSELSTPAQQAFILYGRDQVLAHPALADQLSRGSAEHPLPLLSEIGDRALARLWTAPPGTLDLLGRMSNQARSIEFDDAYFIAVYRQIEGPDEKPWTVGAILPGSAVGQEAERLGTMVGIGAGLLLFSVIAAIVGGVLVARPMRSIVAVTEAVRRLDLADAPTLPRSRIREIDAASQSLNAMVKALGWFELYLPKRLVHRLLKQGNEDFASAREFDVTVMFTDVSGFTRTASLLSPSQTARFLNAHFALVGRCLEAEGGTIDKYMGDGLMAFWGAPDAQPDHVERACRAAQAIAQAVATDNEIRGTMGLGRVQMRIGISTGPALVGNIGAPNRVNYTLVGDTVNVAQRLEQLGKDLPGADDVTTLITEDCYSWLRDGAGWSFLGRRSIRNRDDEVGVYRLE